MIVEAVGGVPAIDGDARRRSRNPVVEVVNPYGLLIDEDIIEVIEGDEGVFTSEDVGFDALADDFGEPLVYDDEAPAIDLQQVLSWALFLGLGYLVARQYKPPANLAP